MYIVLLSKIVLNNFITIIEHTLFCIGNKTYTQTVSLYYVTYKIKESRWKK